MNKICVAVALQRYFALTPIALRLRELALMYAKRHGAEVQVVSVEATVDLMPGHESTAQKLDSFCEPLIEQGLHVSKRLLDGRPSRVLGKHVKSNDIDLLLIGSHSKRSMLDIGLGSTAAALVRAVSCAVLLVRPSREEVAATRDLMIPGFPYVVPG